MPTNSLEKLRRLLIPVAIVLTIASCGRVGVGGNGGDAKGNLPGYVELEQDHAY